MKADTGLLKKHEKAGCFKNSDDLWGLLFDQASDPIFIIDSNGLICEVNDAAASLPEVTMECLIGMSAWDFFTNTTKVEILGWVEQVINGSSISVHRSYRSKIGDERHLAIRISHFSHDTGDYILANCHVLTKQDELARINQALEADIVNLKQIEERLQRSERNFAEVQRLTKTGSWILDFQTGETDWSLETCRIFGFPDPPPSPHYTEFQRRVHPEDLESVDRGLRESFETGEPRPLEYRFILPDGTKKHIETISQPVKDTDGKVLHLMGTVMDVTERVEVEAALRRSKDYLHLVTDTIPELVWSAQPDGHIEYLNKRWLDFTGIDPEKSCGWGWQAAYHPEDLPGLTEHWKCIINSGMAGEAEARLRRSDGVYRWFLIRAVPLHDENGKLVKWYGTNTDIEDRKHAETLLSGEKRILEMIASGDELNAILCALCRLIEKISTDSIASILLIGKDGKSLHHGAAPSLPRAYTEAIDGGLIGPCAASCGTSAYRRETVIVTDIGTDPLWAEYRHIAQQHNLLACWSTPILSSEFQVIGTFALYTSPLIAPTEKQLEMIERFSHLASIAIEHIHSRETMQRSEAYLTHAQILSKTGSFGWNPASGDLYWSAETFRIFDCDSVNSPTMELVLSRVHPDDDAHVRRSVALATKEKSNMDFEHRLLFEDGTIKHLHIVASETKYSTGEYVGAVMDVTLAKLSAAALQASERFARGQAEALTSALDALASETSADRIVEHVLQIITAQLSAQSCSVWLKNDQTELMDFEFALEENTFKSRSNPELAAISPSLKIQDIWPWPEVFRTGKPYILADIREAHEFPWRAHVLAQGVVTIAIVPMLMAGKVAGVIGIRFTKKREFSHEETDLAQALANQAMLAIHLNRLSKQSLDTAIIAERNRMARDIHDTLAQGFTGVIVQLEAAEEALSKKLKQKALSYIGRAGELARESLSEARRSVSALRPQALVQKSLCEALPCLMRKMTAGTGLEINFRIEGQQRILPPDWEHNLLRISQEVLTNAIRYAAASEFRVLFVFSIHEIALHLHDNGRGFDPAEIHDGFGLHGMRERVESMGGEFTIESKLHSGTSVSIVLPLSAAC